MTFCNPMDCSTATFPDLHQLLELVQIHVHLVGDVLQPSHPLSSPSPSTFNLSEHQGLFQWVGSSHQVYKVLEIQHQSFQWIFRTDFLEDTGLISLQSKGLSRIFSNTTVKSINTSVLSLPDGPTLTSIYDHLEGKKKIALTRQTFVGKAMLWLFSILSRFVITFLPRIKHLLISWLQSPPTMICKPPK